MSRTRPVKELKGSKHYRNLQMDKEDIDDPVGHISLLLSLTISLSLTR